MNVSKLVPESIRILLVDDEPNLLKTFRDCLEDVGYRVATASDAMQAEQRIQKEVFDICFLDLRLGETSGLDLLAVLRQHAPWMKIVMMTGHSSIDNAVDAMSGGAVDYLVKPCSLERLRLAAAKQAEARRLEQRLVILESERAPIAQLDSSSPAMRKVLHTVHQIATTDVTILLMGESGTGKSVVARAIHSLSARASAPFATVNCPSLSMELLESELFGHKKGSFTGASENRLGRVDYAQGGTVFLDEIGDVPLTLQPKLLRFIQDREYERIGDPVTRHADVRIIAATNHKLENMVREGAFREDLFYRLNVITITLPSLRERPEDIEPLAEQFLARFKSTYHRPAGRFTPAARSVLREYAWPGNVRELENVIERASILCSESEVDVTQLSIGPTEKKHHSLPRAGDALSLTELEHSHIASIMATSSTLEAAAKTLGIDTSTLYRKRKQYGL